MQFWGCEFLGLRALWGDASSGFLTGVYGVAWAAGVLGAEASLRLMDDVLGCVGWFGCLLESTILRDFRVSSSWGLRNSRVFGVFRGLQVLVYVFRA